MKKFNPLQFIKKLSAIYHRQCKQETRALQYIMRILYEYEILFTKESFETYIPKFISATLRADGQYIPAIPTSFVSGTITSKYNIISSLISSQRFIEDSNINFNPHCRSISRSNHYFAPSLAVEPKYLKVICDAKKILGKVKVKKIPHTSRNILVGNVKNPQNILFAHYDSIGPGAVDDASGIALFIKVILENPKTLENTLFVLAGNEELSYDKPLYWGHGYRAFEKKHYKLLKNAKLILAVDCIGNTKPVLYKNEKIVKLGLPLKNLKQWIQKTHMLSCEMDALMEIYHSDVDTWEKIKIRYFDEAFEKLNEILMERGRR